MNAADFRRIALSLEGAVESSHMGAPDFRVGGRIFATLASEDEGYGNLMLTPELQTEFVRELPEVSYPFMADGEGWAPPTSASQSERGRADWRAARGVEVAPARQSRGEIDECAHPGC